jgi:hypothetical protein
MASYRQRTILSRKVFRHRAAEIILASAQPFTNSREALVLSSGRAGINREWSHRRKVPNFHPNEQQRLVLDKVSELVIAALA